MPLALQYFMDENNNNTSDVLGDEGTVQHFWKMHLFAFLLRIRREGQHHSHVLKMKLQPAAGELDPPTSNFTN